MSSDLMSRVTAVIVEKLEVEAEKVVSGASFVDDLGADSLQTVDLIMGLEDEFGVTIADEAAEKIRTVQDAVDFLNSQGIE